MKLTGHAEARKKQRGFSDAILQIIEENGVYERAPGGAVKIFFGKREHRMVVERLKRFIQLADKAKGGTIILDNNKVLTVYKRS
ncbi:MAG TPA: hypothetical protein PK712_10115 [Rectinema sp.]|jgi:hypothetical protein|nr:hypothetical protein [Rectinema sp.]